MAVNAIIILIIIGICVIGMRNIIKRVKGEGGCCGGGSSVTKIKPQKLENVVGTKIIIIDGMSCDTCRIRVENKLNSIDQVNARVYLKNREAVVKMGKIIDDDKLRHAIESAGYKVVSIERA